MKNLLTFLLLLLTTGISYSAESPHFEGYANGSDGSPTVSEWMQGGPTGILPVDNKYGSDGSVFVARIHWSKPNQNV